MKITVNEKLGADQWVHEFLGPVTPDRVINEWACGVCRSIFRTNVVYGMNMVTFGSDVLVSCPHCGNTERANHYDALDDVLN